MRAFRRREERGGRRPPRVAVVGSVALHAAVALVAVLVGSSLAPPLPAQVYRVQLVAAADPEAPERLTPQPAPPEEEERRPPPPDPAPDQPRPETPTPAVEREETPPPEPEREPARAPEEGEETVNVQLDGAVFPFPGYLENIIRQVNRYWRRPTGSRSLRAEIAFTIGEDGSVTDITWVRRSGDATFDLVARGAIETAGRERAFGPLPEGYPRDRLRVSFFFDPSSL